MALKQRGHSYDAYDDCLNVKTSTLWVKLKIERAENYKKKTFYFVKNLRTNRREREGDRIYW